MNLEKLVNDAMKEIGQSDVAQKLIREKMESTLKHVIDDLFGSYSDFSKTMKKRIAEQLEVDLDKFGIPTYNSLIAAVVREKMDEAIHVQGVEKMKTELDEILKVNVTSFKLSELVEEMKKDERRFSDEEGGEISFHCEKGSTLSFIYFDPEEDKEKYECKYHITLHGDGRIHSIDIDRRKFDTRLIMGGFHGIDRTLFQLYSAGGTIILDDDDIEIEYGYREDY